MPAAPCTSGRRWTKKGWRAPSDNFTLQRPRPDVWEAPPPPPTARDPIRGRESSSPGPWRSPSCRPACEGPLAAWRRRAAPPLPLGDDRRRRRRWVDRGPRGPGSLGPCRGLAFRRHPSRGSRPRPDGMSVRDPL